GGAGAALRGLLVEEAHQSGAVVLRDHLANPRRQAIAFGKLDAVRHVGRDDPSAFDWLERIVGVDPVHLILDEEIWPAELSNVVVVGYHPRQQWIGSHLLRRALG